MTTYCTTEYATEYFETRLHIEAWLEASEQQRVAALTMATEAIDRLNFLGEKSSDDQENQFPRAGDTEVPIDIQKACAEIALALLDGVDPELEFENLAVGMHSYSNVRTTYERSRAQEHIVAGIPSITAWRYIRPYLRDDRSVTLNRA